jgi:hypothetical protein
MPVYLDKSEHRYGLLIMCHMIADTPVELKNMALRIGVGLRWFQAKASTPHFDICKSKRALAIEAGALVVDRHEFVAVMQRIRKSWPRRQSDARWLLPLK